MKKIALTLVISALLSHATFAATEKTALGSAINLSNIGINYSLDDVFGTQFEFDVSKMANNAPVAMQIFWKSYSQHISDSSIWNTTSVGVSGIYDLTAISKLDKKFHPYAGLGLMSVSYSWAGMGPTQNYTGVNGGLYVTGGVRYNINPQIAADVNYNNFGGITVGANFNF